ncbi:MAG: hypothetical protein SFV19_07465 [Rhodospirillaceae bacterium]|nr:hypothetical protein [Rhodospirillaceae bacterium]
MIAVIAVLIAVVAVLAVWKGREFALVVGDFLKLRVNKPRVPAPHPSQGPGGLTVKVGEGIKLENTKIGKVAGVVVGREPAGPVDVKVLDGAVVKNSNIDSLTGLDAGGGEKK